MPRSQDGRWQGSYCKQCEEHFEQLRPGQEFCSRACSNKANPGTGGRKPAAGLEERTCPVCGGTFQPYRENQRSCSRKCFRKLPDVAEKVRAHHAQEHIRERKNAARRTDPNQVQRVRVYNRRTTLARWGWTPEQYEQALEAQQGRCQICGSLPKPDGIKAESKLHADHDHVTGARRDLLCSGCNKGLGCFRDDPELLSVAADYVLRHRKNTVTQA